MTAIELINLTLNEIRRSAQVIADVTAESEMILPYQTGETVKDILSERIKQNKDALNQCRIALREVLEDIAEYQNSCDMVSGVDAELGKVACDLIYERKTEKDYD